MLRGYLFKVIPCWCDSQYWYQRVGQGLREEYSSDTISSITHLRSSFKELTVGEFWKLRALTSLALKQSPDKAEAVFSSWGEDAICLLESFAQILVWVQADGF